MVAMRINVEKRAPISEPSVEKKSIFPVESAKDLLLKKLLVSGMVCAKRNTGKAIKIMEYNDVERILL